MLSMQTQNRYYQSIPNALLSAKNYIEIFNHSVPSFIIATKSIAPFPFALFCEDAAKKSSKIDVKY